MSSTWYFITKEDGDLSQVLASAALDERTFSQWISDTLEERGLQKNSVVRSSRLNQTFAYQIMAGTRNASRDKLIQLAFGMGLDIDEASDLLERGGTSALRPSCRRDVVIAFCLHNQLGVATCDDLLWGLGEHTLISANGDSRRTRSQ